MGFNLGAFGQGFSKTYDAKAVGGAINDALTNSAMDDVEAQYKDKMKALDTERANSKGGVGENGPVQPMSDADYSKRRKAIETDRVADERKAYEKYKGRGSYDDYQLKKNKAAMSEIETQNAKTKQEVIDAFSGDDWKSLPGMADRLNYSSGLVNAMGLGNAGKFQIGEDGKIYNDTGKGFVELTDPTANMIVKRAAMASIIGERTGNFDMMNDVMEQMRSDRRLKQTDEQLAQSDRHFNLTRSDNERHRQEDHQRALEAEERARKQEEEIFKRNRKAALEDYERSLKDKRQDAGTEHNYNKEIAAIGAQNKADLKKEEREWQIKMEKFKQELKQSAGAGGRASVSDLKGIIELLDKEAAMGKKPEDSAFSVDKEGYVVFKAGDTLIPTDVPGRVIIDARKEGETPKQAIPGPSQPNMNGKK